MNAEPKFDRSVLADVAERCLREAVMATLRGRAHPIMINDIARFIYKRTLWSRDWWYNLVRPPCSAWRKMGWWRMPAELCDTA